jgi:hypothetical protein
MLLLLGLSSLLINNIAIENDQGHIAVERIQGQACCPNYNITEVMHYVPLIGTSPTPSLDFHASSIRRVKRFFCLNQSCPRKSFAERFSDLVDWYQRQTNRVREKQAWLRTNALARGAVEDHQLDLSNTSINWLLRSLHGAL